MYVSSSKRIKIFASGLKGLRTIQGIRDKTEHVFVIIGKDDNVKNDFSVEIEEICKKEGVQYSHDLKDDGYEFGLAIAAGWQRMIHDIPSSALIVFHDSLLPKYRGFNPLVTALLNKDEFIGVTALFAADKYDCGDIVYQLKVFVDYPILIADAINKISDLYYDLATKVYDLFISEDLKGRRQDDNIATYSLWRDSDDYAINWSDSAENIQLLVNSVGYPYLGASTLIKDKLFRVKKTKIMTDLVIENRAPGKIIFFDGEMPVVVCGKGLLRLDHLEDSDGNIFVVTKLRTRFA